MKMNLIFKPEATCSCCGRFGAFDFGEEFLCSDCYAEKGSCCLEFGGHDLWNEKIEKHESQNHENQNSD